MARPVLLNSCARAATTAEAKFRIDYPLAASRATRVLALDAGAVDVVRSVSESSWNHARFYVASAADGLELTTVGGDEVALAGELDGVDAFIMVATDDDGAPSAAMIGAACSVRGVMTAGLVISSDRVTSEALIALRPHARILLAPADEEDLFELLKAIRA